MSRRTIGSYIPWKSLLLILVAAAIMAAVIVEMTGPARAVALAFVMVAYFMGLDVINHRIPIPPTASSITASLISNAVLVAIIAAILMAAGLTGTGRP